MIWYHNENGKWLPYTSDTSWDNSKTVGALPDSLGSLNRADKFSIDVSEKMGSKTTSKHKNFSTTVLG